MFTIDNTKNGEGTVLRANLCAVFCVGFLHHARRAAARADAPPRTAAGHPPRPSSHHPEEYTCCSSSSSFPSPFCRAFLEESKKKIISPQSVIRHHHIYIISISVARLRLARRRRRRAKTSSLHHQSRTHSTEPEEMRNVFVRFFGPHLLLLLARRRDGRQHPNRSGWQHHT